VQASADDCCLIILDLLKSIAQMNHSDAFHNSASPQESSGSLLPLLAHSSAPKSPGPLAIQLHAIDSSIQTGPTDIPQGELHSLAHCSDPQLHLTMPFLYLIFRVVWLTQIVWHRLCSGITFLRCLAVSVLLAYAFCYFGCSVH